MKHSYSKYLASALLATFGAAAMAQTPPAAPVAPGPHMHAMREGHGYMDSARWRERMDERMARRQAALKQKLGITAAQEGAWTAWSAAMKPPAPPANLPDRAALDRMTTPERIDRMRALRAERQAQMDSRANATKTFYAALTPEQQKTFDQLSPRMMAGERGRRDGWHHHGGPRG